MLNEDSADGISKPTKTDESDDEQPTMHSFKNFVKSHNSQRPAVKEQPKADHVTEQDPATMIVEELRASYHNLLDKDLSLADPKHSPGTEPYVEV